MHQVLPLGPNVRLRVWGAPAPDEMIRVPMGRDSILCGTNEVNNGFWLGNRLALTFRCESSTVHETDYRESQYTTHARKDCTDYSEDSRSSTIHPPTMSLIPILCFSPICFCFSSYYIPFSSLTRVYKVDFLYFLFLTRPQLCRTEFPLHSRAQADLNLIIINQGSLHRAVVHICIAFASSTRPLIPGQQAIMLNDCIYPRDTKQNTFLLNCSLFLFCFYLCSCACKISTTPFDRLADADWKTIARNQRKRPQL